MACVDLPHQPPAPFPFTALHVFSEWPLSAGPFDPLTGASGQTESSRFPSQHPQYPLHLTGACSLHIGSQFFVGLFQCHLYDFSSTMYKSANYGAKSWSCCTRCRMFSLLFRKLRAISSFTGFQGDFRFPIQLFCFFLQVIHFLLLMLDPLLRSFHHSLETGLSLWPGFKKFSGWLFIARLQSLLSFDIEIINLCLQFPLLLCCIVS